MDIDPKTSSDSVIPSNQTDFEQIWLRIATDIKIRKFENLDDIPEFHQLSNQLRDELNNAVTTLNDSYKVFYDEQELKNFHVILFVQDKENYLAIYEEQTQSQQMRAIANNMGLTKLYHCLSNSISKTSGQGQELNNDQQEQPQSVEENNSNNTESSGWRDYFPVVSTINSWQKIRSFFQKSSSTSEPPYNKLIEICMLHKLKSLSNAE